MTDKIDRFVNERWDDAKYLDGNEIGDLHRETLRELGECAAEVDRLVAERDAAERRESELGLQVVAQAARLRLADDVASASRKVLNEVLAVIADDAGHDEPWFICPHGELFDALAAWDAVPGDDKEKT